ncbi:hypothetical protein MMC30_005623 [Trapelia coarctata]|nr:hypothetical protein [Trapelia coarctata]
MSGCGIDGYNLPGNTDQDVFEEKIVSHSSQSSRSSLYPGQSYIGLANYLRQRLPSSASEDWRNPALLPRPKPPKAESFAVLHDFGRNSNHIKSFDADEGLHDFDEYPIPAEGGLLLFMRGYPSPEWLKLIGVKYEVDPEFYQRHLQFQTLASGIRDHFATPSLPSTRTHIFDLCFSSIVSRDTEGPSYGPEDLRELRQQSADATTKYHRDLKYLASVGDSVVRRHSILSKQLCVVEQTVSVHVRCFDTGWRAIVWLDHGRDLSHTTPGPWSPPEGSEPWETYYLPTLQYIPDLALRQNSKLLIEDSRLHTPQQPWAASQNASLVPFLYGQSLDINIIRQDPFYALHEVFSFAAFSEAQFLNLMKSRIDHELQFVGINNECSMANLRYVMGLLDDHKNKLAENVTTLVGCSFGFEIPDDKARATQAAKARSLQRYYEYLHHRAEALSWSWSCRAGMETLTSSSVLAENRKAMKNAEDVRKLTILATLFIPFTFTCSFFGMNFVEFGQGKLSLWVWVVASVSFVGGFFAVSSDKLPEYLRTAYAYLRRVLYGI